MARTSRPTAEQMARDPEKYKLEKVGKNLRGSHNVSGGKLADIDGDVRMFTIPGFSRSVRVTVTKFILGSHYHVRITEQDNSIWDNTSAEKWVREGACVWTKAWDDREADGRVWNAEYKHTRFIEPFVEKILRENFEGIKFHIDRETLGATEYGRDGD